MLRTTGCHLYTVDCTLNAAKRKVYAKLSPRHTFFFLEGSIVSKWDVVQVSAGNAIGMRDGGWSRGWTCARHEGGRARHGQRQARCRAARHGRRQAVDAGLP